MSRIVAVCIGAAVIAGGLAVAPVHGATTKGGPSYAFCPPATHILGPHAHWNDHHLAPGITMSATTVRTGKRRLRINVVRADLNRERVGVGSLHHALTTRRPLTKLAKRPHLVAATNGTYFDFGFGAPTVPFIGIDGPKVLSVRHERVAGIGLNRRAQDGRVWLVGHVTSRESRHSLVALNEVQPPPGLSLYTSDWGSQKVPLPALAATRIVRGGSIIGKAGHRRRVPHHGTLLVATSPGSVEWLNEQPQGSATVATYRAVTNAKQPFRQAYGVGTRVVASRHHVRSGLYCRRGAEYAARTDIAWNHHGRHLLLVTVASPLGSEGHGIDENQMSQIMVRLGAARSYALDGGGSTELVARLHHDPRLAPRSPLSSGAERRIPLGVGIYSLPKSVAKKIRQHENKHKHHHRPRHHHHRHGTKRPHCLLKVVLCPK